MKTSPRIIACALGVCLAPALIQAEAPPIVDYDWASQPVTGYRNFDRVWEAGSATTERIPFNNTQPLSPSTSYDGPEFFGSASAIVSGTLNGSTPASISSRNARVSNRTEGDDLEMRVATPTLSNGGEVSIDAAALYLFRPEESFELGDTSLRYVNGNKSNDSRFQWVIQTGSGNFYVSDMSIALKATGTEYLSNNLTSRGWATFSPWNENLLGSIGAYRSPAQQGIDFTDIVGAGVLVTQSSVQEDSGTPMFYATVREFEIFKHDPLRDERHLSSYYFGNSLTGSTYPEGHGDLGASVGKSWDAIAKLGAGWQLWQHRYELYVGADLGDLANGDYTLDPSQQGDSVELLDKFVSMPWEVMVMQAFGNVLWDETVQAGEEKFDITFEETTNVGDPQSADDLMAAYLALNPEGRVFLYTNWYGMPHGIVPPYNQWPDWTDTYAKVNELVPGEISNEFPDRDAFVYDTKHFDFYQVESPPWFNDRNWTRDYHNQLFEELTIRYPQLWSQGRLSAIPLAEVFRRLDRIYQSGGDPEMGNPTVGEKITRIADFYADALHVKGGMAQFTCAASFYAALHGEHPGELDWNLYNNPDNWGDDPTHDATPLLLITEDRAAQVCDVIWDVLTSHPYSVHRISPFHGKNLNKSGMASVWGSNSHGQIGREELVGNRTSPVPLEDDLTVVPGGNFAFALYDNGKSLAFGQNHRGQLGDSTKVNRRFPYEVTLLTNAQQIATGTNHAAAVTGGGAVFAWGSNNQGELGDDFGRFGDATNEFPNPPENPSPRRVNGVSNATMVACGNGFTLARLSDGTVKAWGRDNYGQLGDGSPQATGNSTPETISGLSSITKIAAAGDFALALRSNGVVYAWGRNNKGQLGLGDTSSRSTPTQIPGLSGIVDIAAGDEHAIAVDGSGTVYVWGSNSDGQLAFDPATTATRTSPAAKTFSFDVDAVAAGRAHSLALASDGRVYAWGANNAGQLGIGSTTRKTSPQLVSGLSNIRSIAAAGDLSSAKRTGAPTSNQTPTANLNAPSSALTTDVVSLSVSAADSDGSVISVEILVNGDFLAKAKQQGATNTWTYDWYFPEAGSASVRARVTDNDGATRLSSIRTVSVTEPDSGTDPGTGPGTDPAGNPIVDPGFNNGFEDGSGWAKSTVASNVDAGWVINLANSKWNIINDPLNGSNKIASADNGGASSMVQIITNNYAIKGRQNVTFDGSNVGTGNEMIIGIWGVNEDFRVNLWNAEGPVGFVSATDYIGQSILTPVNVIDKLGDWRTPVELSGENTPSGYDIDFGNGYKYLLVKVYTKGVGTSESMYFDNLVIGAEVSDPGTDPGDDPQGGSSILEPFNWASTLDTSFGDNAGTANGAGGLAWTFEKAGFDSKKSINGNSLLLQRNMAWGNGWIEADLPNAITGFKLKFKPRYSGKTQVRVTIGSYSVPSEIAQDHTDLREISGTVTAGAGTKIRIETIGPDTNKDTIIDDLELISSGGGGTNTGGSDGFTETFNTADLGGGYWAPVTEGTTTGVEGITWTFYRAANLTVDGSNKVADLKAGEGYLKLSLDGGASSVSMKFRPRYADVTELEVLKNGTSVGKSALYGNSSEFTTFTVSNLGASDGDEITIRSTGASKKQALVDDITFE